MKEMMWNIENSVQKREKPPLNGRKIFRQILAGGVGAVVGGAVGFLSGSLIDIIFLIGATLGVGGIILGSSISVYRAGEDCNETASLGVTLGGSILPVLGWLTSL